MAVVRADDENENNRDDDGGGGESTSRSSPRRHHSRQGGKSRRYLKAFPRLPLPRRRDTTSIVKSSSLNRNHRLGRRGQIQSGGRDPHRSADRRDEEL